MLTDWQRGFYGERTNFKSDFDLARYVISQTLSSCQNLFAPRSSLCLFYSFLFKFELIRKGNMLAGMSYRIENGITIVPFDRVEDVSTIIPEALTAAPRLSSLFSSPFPV
jgi:hypothetical protein